jgi:hypothetical protein
VSVVIAAGGLPPIRKDSFDRLLIAQARMESVAKKIRNFPFFVPSWECRKTCAKGQQPAHCGV